MPPRSGGPGEATAASGSGVPGEEVRDAIFEDVGRGGAQPPPAWDAIPLAPVQPEPTQPEPTQPEPTQPEPVAIQVGDPFAEPYRGDGAARHPSPPPAPPLNAPTPSAAVPIGETPAAPIVRAEPSPSFRIDFGSPLEPSPSTALAPIVPTTAVVPAPSPSVPAPPPPPHPSSAPRAEARRSARDKARMLRRHRWLILLSTLLGLAAFGAYSVLTPPTYTAYSILLINPNKPTPGPSSLDQGFVEAPGLELRKVLNQALILDEDPTIAESTATTLLDRRDVGRLTTVEAAAAKYGRPVTASALSEYLQEKVITVKPAAEEVDALRVQAKAGSAAEAALVASIYTDQYLRQTRSTNRSRVTQTREILQTQLGDREAELASLEARLESFMTQENAAGLDEQTRTSVSQIGSLQSQLDVARVQAQTYQAQLSQLQSDLASVPGRLSVSAQQAATASPAATQQLDAQIGELERLVEQIYLQNPDLRRNPGSHPDLRRLNDRLDGLKAERRRLGAGQADAAIASGGLDMTSSGSNGAAYVADLQRQISQTRAALEGARAQASALSARLGESRSQLRQVPGQKVELEQLERRRLALEGAVAQLQRELDQTRLAESTELGLAQVVREVQTPRKPSGPNLPLNLALGTVLGLLVGLTVAAVRYRTDAHAHTPSDLEEQGFVVLGTVPDIRDAFREARHDIEGSLVHPALVTLTRSFAPEAEAFRHLHAGLYANADAAPTVVLVTGPEVGTGKSIVAANLAAAAAQAGRRVLLVDADLRKPSVGALLGLEPQHELGAGPDGTNLVYWSTAVPGLFAMTPRDAAARPDQMWAPHQVGALLQNLRQAFDLVLIDAPPALAEAGPTLLAPHVDAAILVAQSGRSDVDAMTQVATELSGVGLRRIGAVLNRFTPSKAVGYKRTAAVRHSAGARS